MIVRFAHGQARATISRYRPGFDGIAVAAVGGDPGGDVVGVAVELATAGDIAHGPVCPPPNLNICAESSESRARLSFAPGTHRGMRVVSTWIRSSAPRPWPQGLVNRYQLATRYDAVYRNVYIPRGQVLTPAEGACRVAVVGPEATVVGVSAAALHGSLWIDRRSARRTESTQSAQDQRHRAAQRHLSRDETRVIDGASVTTPARTAFDLGRRYGRTLAVIRVDALMRGHRPQAFGRRVTGRPPSRRSRHRPTARSRRLADAGAESPQETRTRLVLTDAGLTTDAHPDRRIQLVGRTSSAVSTWVGRNGGSAWSTTANNTGRTRAIRARDIDRQRRSRSPGLAHRARQRRDVEYSAIDDCSARTRSSASRRPKLKLCGEIPRIFEQKFSFGAKPNVRRRARCATARTTSDTRRATLRSG